MSSCSGWMVATMSRIGPDARTLDLGLEDLAVHRGSASSGAVVSAGPVSVSSSYAVTTPCWKPNRRRSRRPIGSVRLAR